MRDRMRAGLALAVVLGACGTPAAMVGDERDAGQELVCTPGESRACACSSGATGTQVCADDGRRLEACVCAGLDGGMPERDAAQPVEDAGVDAGRDAGPGDAGPPPVCDLYSRELCTAESDCGPTRTCRRAERWDDPGGHHTGEPECQPVGRIFEHNYGFVGTCTDSGSEDRCGCGLFCLPAGECVRYCDPGGEPCPAYRGEPQHCVTELRHADGDLHPVPNPFCHYGTFT